MDLFLPMIQELPHFSAFDVDPNRARLLQKNYFDAIEVKHIVSAANSFKDFLTSRKTDLLTKIRNEAKLTDEIEAGLKAAADEWKSTFVAK